MACATMGMDDLKANETYEFAFLKIDIVEHSRITHDCPYREIEGVFDAFEEYVERHVSNHNGNVWGWQGDGGLCAFLGKDTTEKARNAYNAAESILVGLDHFNKSSPLPRGYRVRVRVAVHLGSAKYRGPEALGRIHSEAINFVAHLESQKTNVNGISISHEVYKELTEDIQKRFEAIEKFEGKEVYTSREERAELLDPTPGGVVRFMHTEDLWVSSTQIDLHLYTGQTIPNEWRDPLRKVTHPLHLRLLIRDPKTEPDKLIDIRGALHGISELAINNPNVRLDVRFYSEDPSVRLHIFHTSKGLVGLVGMYTPDRRGSGSRIWVGADDSEAIVCKAGRSRVETLLLNSSEDWFEHVWRRKTLPRAVLFDLDGVIIDSMHWYAEAWEKAFKDRGINIDRLLVYEREGEDKKETVRFVFKQQGRDAPDSGEVGEIVENVERLYLEKFTPTLVPGVAELLTALKAKGVLLALVTGSRQAMIDECKRANPVFDLFDVVVTGEVGGRGKPYPDPYKTAVERIAEKAGRQSKEMLLGCYVVENGPFGIQSAKSANLTCFAIKGSSLLSLERLQKAGADFVYKSMKELARHLLWVDVNLPLKELLLQMYPVP